MPKAIHAASAPAFMPQDPLVREGSPIAKLEDSVVEKENAQEPMTISAGPDLEEVMKNLSELQSHLANMGAARSSDARCGQSSDFEGRAATLSLQKLQSSKEVSTKICAAREIGLIHGCLFLQETDEKPCRKWRV